ncbi:MAG TPA: hypothetical protein VFG76_11710, partial [Candidatus Polarisedimenticolia bacterium]|nr:hypothetical protein [Candidatus Polarisedimenticolia bacterium]
MKLLNASRVLAVLSLLDLTGVSVASDSASRRLSFEDRVRAQEAIERVYYSHQTAAVLPFQQAVPRALLEKKVRTTLAQSQALERVWGRPITASDLRAEAERMARDTRMPERLRELYAALGDDPVLILECLVRPALADRLVRSRFAT